MNFLTNEEYVSEISCGQNFAYILNSQIVVSQIEYKVLQNQKDSFFIKCIQGKYNENIQLYYLAEEYKTLDSLLMRIDVASFITVMKNLFSNIIELKNNGFLSCQNVLISPEKIYVDPGTLEVYLIYIPTERSLYHDMAEFENELRTRLLRVISAVPMLNSPEIRAFVEYLSDNTMLLSDIYNMLCGKLRVTMQKSVNVSPDSSMAVNRKCMRLLSINMPIAEEIRIIKDDFIIGKKQGMVDAVIGFSPMVSRTHCRVVRKNESFYISDMGSSNGTYVNERRVMPAAFEELVNGDIIRLANAEFRVIIE